MQQLPGMEWILFIAVSPFAGILLYFIAMPLAIFPRFIKTSSSGGGRPGASSAWRASGIAGVRIAFKEPN